MKIRLLKDHTLGKQNDVIDIEDKKGNYLVRMKVAEIESFNLAKGISAVSMGIVREKLFEKEKTEDENYTEKYEVIPQKEKQEHEGLPTAKKRGRKPKK